MNRAIKFRGIVKDGRGPDNLQGKWHYGSLILFGGGHASIVPINTTDEMAAIFRGEYDCMLPTLEVDIETVGQFIGRCDVTGKEAYEGDKIVYASLDGEAVLCWRDANSSIGYVSRYINGPHEGGAMLIPNKFKIVGSIHDIRE